MRAITFFLFMSFWAAACMTNTSQPVNSSNVPIPPEPTGSQPDAGHQGGAFTISTDAFYQASIQSPTSPGRVISLSLSPKGAAEMNTDYLDTKPVVTDSGEWTTLENGNLLLNLRRETNNDSIILEFKTDGEKLIYTGSEYGANGLVLWAKPVVQSK